MHLGIFHVAVNIVALVPLFEKFEAEHGTLRTIVLFFGRKIMPMP
jgi:membrane associated rhomboid family serine protease